jgi:hypothetical protein
VFTAVAAGVVADAASVVAPAPGGSTHNKAANMINRHPCRLVDATTTFRFVFIGSSFRIRGSGAAV